MRLTTKWDITENACFGQRTPICEGDATAETILDPVKDAPEEAARAQRNTYQSPSQYAATWHLLQI
jgi:hypothetical protein